MLDPINNLDEAVAAYAAGLLQPLGTMGPFKEGDRVRVPRSGVTGTVLGMDDLGYIEVRHDSEYLDETGEYVGGYRHDSLVHETKPFCP